MSRRRLVVTGLLASWGFVAGVSAYWTLLLIGVRWWLPTDPDADHAETVATFGVMAFLASPLAGAAGVSAAMGIARRWLSPPEPDA